MRIAVTYDDGFIYQHFGRTECFKLYEVEDGKVVFSEVISSNGVGHGALAELLAVYGVQVVICGGLGEGALNALHNAGLTVVAGATGKADDAVAAFMRGELEDSGANCDHHHHGEDHECCGGHGEEDHECCGGHGEEDHECCGGHGENGGGCCGGGHVYTMEGKNVGKNVRVHYKGTFNDGTQFDSSYDRGEPLEFVCGAGMMIPGYDAAVANMEVGETIEVHLMPSEAYGEADPNAIFTIDMEQLPGSEALAVGQRVYLQNAYGQPFAAMVAAKDEKTITFDANHEMAGKELNFTIELVEVLEA